MPPGYGWSGAYPSCYLSPPWEGAVAGVCGGCISWIAAHHVTLKQGASAVKRAKNFHCKLFGVHRTEGLLASFKYSHIPTMKCVNAAVQSPVILKIGITTSALKSICFGRDLLDLKSFFKQHCGL